MSSTPHISTRVKAGRVHAAVHGKPGADPQSVAIPFDPSKPAWAQHDAAAFALVHLAGLYGQWGYCEHGATATGTGTYVCHSDDARTFSAEG